MAAVAREQAARMDARRPVHSEVSNVVAVVGEYLNARRVFPRTDVALDRVLLALLSKSLRVASAIAVLVNAGFAEEAFGLSRTLLETAFTVRYITNRDSISRARRYVDYLAKDYADWMRLVAKHYPDARPPRNQDHEEMMETARAFNSPHSWTGLGGQTKEMAMELVAEPEEPGARWEFDYEAVYKWTSHYVHVTSPALERHFCAPREAFRVYGGTEPGGMPRLALLNATIFLLKICLRAFPALGLEAQAVQPAFDAAIAVLR